MGRIIPYIIENKKNMFQTTNQNGYKWRIPNSWLVSFMEKPKQKWIVTGGSPLFRKPPYIHQNGKQLICHLLPIQGFSKAGWSTFWFMARKHWPNRGQASQNGEFQASPFVLFLGDYACNILNYFSRSRVFYHIYLQGTYYSDIWPC